MKKILIWVLCLSPLAATAKDKELTGYWKEVKRMTLNNNPVPFEDTIIFQFLPHNEYTWQKKNSFIYKGTYKHEGNTIDIGRNIYTVVSQRGNRLVLKDDMGMYEFVPYTPPGQTKLPPPEKYGPVKSLNGLAGNWSVYKRTSEKTLQEVDYNNQIKKIEILAQPDNGKLGYVYGGYDADGAPSWYIENYDANTQTMYLAGKTTNRQLKVLKGERGELIIEESPVTYFFKQFR